MNSKTSFGELPGLSRDLYKRLHDTLVQCPQFSNNEKLQAVFVDARIYPWKVGIPETQDRGARVYATINYLYTKHSTSGDNALVLLLLVLNDQTHSGDDLRRKLSILASDLEKYTGNNFSNAHTVSERQIRQIVEQSFDLDGLELFCFDYFDLNIQNLKGATLQNKVFHLFRTAEREGWTERLLAALKDKFPTKF